jgi:hypothetical protein
MTVSAFDATLRILESPGGGRLAMLAVADASTRATLVPRALAGRRRASRPRPSNEHRENAGVLAGASCRVIAREDSPAQAQRPFVPAFVPAHRDARDAPPGASFLRGAEVSLARSWIDPAGSPPVLRGSFSAVSTRQISACSVAPSLRPPIDGWTRGRVKWPGWSSRKRRPRRVPRSAPIPTRRCPASWSCSPVGELSSGRPASIDRRS